MAKTSTHRKGAKTPAQTEETLRSDWRTPPARKRKPVRKYSSAGPAGQAPAGGPHRKTREETTRLPVPSRRSVLRFVKVTFLVVVIGAVGFGMYELLRLPQLAITSSAVQIGGAQRIPPLRIFEATQAEGRNIFLLRAAELESRVLNLPGISEAHVHLRLPNQMIVDIVEHAPLVAWKGPAGTVWLAEDAAEVPQAGDAPPLTVTDESGVGLEASRKLWPLVLKNLSELHAARDDIRDLYYGKTEGLYYRSPQGWAVWLGDSGPVSGKLALVAAAQEQLTASGKRPKVIDVRLSGRRALYW